MYLPRNFREDDIPTLQAFIQQYDFGILIGMVKGEFYATHIPMILDTARGECGTLIGHMARANPHWKGIYPEDEVMVIFSGPHTYVSSTWYEPQTMIPTWNYMAVHAYGTPTLIHDVEKLDGLLSDMLAVYDPTLLESGDAIPPNQLKAIVGIEVEISHLQGKFKLSQNKTLADQARVVEQLSHSASQDAQAIAQQMQHRLQEQTEGEPT